MSIKFGTLVLAFSVGMVARVHAEDCGQILQYGIWETRKTDMTTANSSEFANWACSARAQSNQRGTNLNIPDYGNLNDTSSGASSASDCSSSRGKFALSSEFKERIKTAAKSIVDAWERCIAAPGSNVSILYGSDPKLFIIYLRRIVDTGTAKAKAVITMQTSGNGTANCSGGDAFSGTFDGSRAISCKRSDPALAIQLAVNFQPGGGKFAFVPAILPPPPPPTAQTIHIKAVDYISARHVGVSAGSDAAQWGNGIILNSPSSENAPNSANWRVTASVGGKYRLDVEYAAETARPVMIEVNGQVWRNTALNVATGCWQLRCQTFVDQGIVDLKNGDNIIGMSRGSWFPHIRELRFTPVTPM